MKVALIGNGILSLHTAYRLLKADTNLRLEILGPADRPGCATLAAAAMLNSFCEVDTLTLKNPIERQRFLFNRASSALWPELLETLQRESGMPLNHGFGTFLINTSALDRLEDDNFDAILSALNEFKEPFETTRPDDITGYKPAAPYRAHRALYLPHEGWVNPLRLMDAFQHILQASGRVQFTEGTCHRLVKGKGATIEAAESTTGSRIVADRYVLCPGANFSQIVDRSKLELPMMRIFYGVGATLVLAAGKNTPTHCIRTPNRGMACGVYCTPHAEGQALIGASNLITPDPTHHPRAISIYTLLKSAMEQIHTEFYQSNLLRINVGWRPTSADTLPLIGKTSLSNLWVATGTKRDGLHCSPLISQYLSDLILKGSSQHDLSLFKPERKRTRIYSRDEAIRIAVTHTLNAAYKDDFVPPKNTMLDHLKQHYTEDFNQLHDKVGAKDWGIPPELIDLYRDGHIQ